MVTRADEPSRAAPRRRDLATAPWNDDPAPPDLLAL